MIFKKELVKTAYILMLGREPENSEVVRAKSKLDINQLRAEFVNSYEFKIQNRSIMTPAIPVVDLETFSELQANAYFSQLVNQWTLLGESEPYWSVLSSDEYSGTMSSEQISKFYDSGGDVVQRYFDLAKSLDVDLDTSQPVLELGCGVGRITKSLSEEFHAVTALDVSPGNLSIARKYLSANSNIEFILVNKLEVIAELPSFGHFISVITLQHNPPQIQDLILRTLLSKVSRGGVAFFQTVTCISSSTQNTNQNLEVENQFSTYSFPMNRVLTILRNLEFDLLEIYRDDFQLDPDFHSYSFFARRK
jgi:2-polyprenyl-3-methyl-5-hydroxy-6-metoxy-1,4-benzoquinol methylase